MSRILQRQELALEGVFPAANSGFYIRKGPFSACSTTVHVGLASLLENKLEIAAEFFSQNLLLDLVQHRCFEFFFVEERGIASQPLFLQVRAAGIVVVLS